MLLSELSLSCHLIVVGFAGVSVRTVIILPWKIGQASGASFITVIILPLNSRQVS